MMEFWFFYLLTGFMIADYLLDLLMSSPFFAHEVKKIMDNQGLFNFFCVLLWPIILLHIKPN
jgi:uncharacterized membrane protein